MPNDDVRRARVRSGTAPAIVPGEPTQGRLRSRPHGGLHTTGGPGVHELELGGGRRALLAVPSRYRPERPAALVVALHGAGGDGAAGLQPLLDVADDAGVALLAPESSGPTWDLLLGGFGPDVELLDRALAEAFRRVRVAPGRVAVGGFSDGASYALSLGVTNGDLFSAILAFSPGFVAPGRPHGMPRIFVSHGVNDKVLRIAATSRRIVPRLERAGYLLRYEEFDGGHTVPTRLAAAALSWLLDD